MFYLTLGFCINPDSSRASSRVSDLSYKLACVLQGENGTVGLSKLVISQMFSRNLYPLAGFKSWQRFEL